MALSRYFKERRSVWVYIEYVKGYQWSHEVRTSFCTEQPKAKPLTKGHQTWYRNACRKGSLPDLTQADPLLWCEKCKECFEGELENWRLYDERWLVHKVLAIVTRKGRGQRSFEYTVSRKCYKLEECAKCES